MARWLKEFWLKLKVKWIKKMIIKATQKYTRQTARKVRLVADVIKKMSIEDALKQLAVMERRASLVVLKTLRQAIANAMNNHQLSLDQLKIKNIIIDEAPTYKRWRAVSRGRAHTILKRSCHVNVILETKETKVKADQLEKKAEKAVAKKTDKKTEAKKKTEVKKTTKKKTSKSQKATKAKTSKTSKTSKKSKKITKKDKK
jgi:large subunit ribosomal protein L22